MRHTKHSDENNIKTTPKVSVVNTELLFALSLFFLPRLFKTHLLKTIHIDYTKNRLFLQFI